MATRIKPEPDENAQTDKAQPEQDPDVVAAQADGDTDDAGRREAAPQERIEVYDLQRPDGSWITITRNIDTGEQTAEDRPE